MTREQAKIVLENAEVIQAWIGGKTLQVKTKCDARGVWSDSDYNPDFGSGYWEWRIKPEPPKPREFWLVGLDNRPYSVFFCKPGNALSGAEIIHVREVVDQ